MENIPPCHDADGNHTGTGLPLRETVEELTGENIDDILGRNFEEEVAEEALMEDGAFI